MFEIAKMTSLRTVELPPAIAEQFGPSDQFIVWVEGDTVHLKRIAASPLQAVADAADEEPASLQEIDDIVHRIRSQRHAQQAP